MSLAIGAYPLVEDSPESDLRDATVQMGRADLNRGDAWFLIGCGSDTPIQSIVSISSSPFTIGRRSDLSLCIPSSTISGSHAEIQVHRGTARLRDLDSRNGTFVNGERIRGEVPLKADDLVQFANICFRMARQSRATTEYTAMFDASDQAMALSRFSELMDDCAVVTHFQPIVSMAGEKVRGYEILGRSRLFGLHSPHQMFSTAAILKMESELSRMLRIEGIKKGMQLPNQPHLFVNTHPLETNNPLDLYRSLEEIRKVNPTQRITLEIHESSALELKAMKNLRVVLESLNMHLAYDDFGAGQARIVELVKIPPDYLKFDMSLIRDIHKTTQQHRQMVGTLVRMALDLGIIPLAEGVESQQDAVVCRELGFDWAQGYYFGKPVAKPSEQFVTEQATD